MARRAHLAVLICLASLIIASPIWPLMAVAHATDISHPNAYVYGTVTKEIMFGQSVWRWEDEQGVDHLLPFAAQESANYTVNAWYINFSRQMENDTFIIEGSGSDIVNKQLDSYGLNVWYVKNVLDSQANNSEGVHLTTDVDVPCGKATHMLFCAKLLTAHGEDVTLGVKLTLVSGASSYNLYIMARDSLQRGSLSTSWTSATGNAWLRIGIDAGDTFLIQIAVERLFNQISGLNIDIDYIDTIQLRLSIYNSTSYTDEYAECFFRFCFFTDGPVYITSKDYGLLNTTLGTEIEIPTSVGDTLNIYGAKADRAYEVQIPFTYEVTPDMTSYADELKIAYTWQFQLPDDTRAGTFSGTGINFTLNKDPGYYDYLYLNGEDKLSAIADATAGDTVTLATGLTTGTLYTLQARVRYTADEYDALTAAPVFWYNPGGWLMYHFWELIAAIASVLGLTTVATKARGRARAYRKPVWR